MLKKEGKTESREPRFPEKGKERQVGHCGRERRLFAWQCAVRVGEALAVRFTVNGRSGQAVRLADGRAREVAKNGR